MEILCHNETETFHLTNKWISYIIHVMENGQLENLYCGKKIHDRSDFGYLHEEVQRSQMSVCVPEPGILSMHYERQEYPAYGTGDYRSPAMVIRQENGSRIVDFEYVGYRILDGKPELFQALSPDRMIRLPATYTEDPGEAKTLEIVLEDRIMKTHLILSYTIFRDFPVITRNARFEQQGEQKIVIERAMSMSLEWNEMNFDLITLSGGWARERYVKRRPLEMGLQGVQGLAGTCSSAEHNPFFALASHSATEQNGEVYGFNLIYSGNFLAQTEVSTFDMTRAMIGINPQDFAWVLDKGECFQTPEAVMVYSDEGLGGMSRTFHRLYRDRLQRGKWRNRPRPILINNWEATYFHFDEDKLLSIASRAKDCGIELFVLDDGWFGARDDDYRGLGDWHSNLKKLPSGISGLSQKVEDLGMKFGLWVELEMVNKDSDLYRVHPDWIISAPDRFQSHARHQYVLDYTRRDVVDFIYESIAKVIRTSKISYIKWDMNRYMTEPYSGALRAEDEGETMHRYILGLYDLYSRLTTEFPDILFESCASGGARFDAGMMFFAPQNWCSDDTDANERTKIQYGTSLVYPVVSMGSHVSAVPNHQLFRSTPLETRGNVAYFGTFGYELDLNLLDPAEIELVKKQVQFMKDHRELIQVDGDQYRLISPFEGSGNETAWMIVSRDKKRAVALYYQRLNKVNGSWLRFRLEGLDPDVEYEVRFDASISPAIPEKIIKVYGLREKNQSIITHRAFGDELMHAGIPISREMLSLKGGDFTSVLFDIEAVE